MGYKVRLNPKEGYYYILDEYDTEVEGPFEDLEDAQAVLKELEAEEDEFLEDDDES